MARIRTIKPDFWSDERVMDVSHSARLLFIGLWNFCDREGRMVYSPKRIKAQIFPGDTLDILVILEELRTIGLITVYECSNAKILSVPNFSRHQVVNAREPISILPTSAVVSTITQQVQSKNTTSTVQGIDQSVQKSEEGKGREGKGIGKEGNGDLLFDELCRVAGPRAEDNSAVRHLFFERSLEYAKDNSLHGADDGAHGIIDIARRYYQVEGFPKSMTNFLSSRKYKFWTETTSKPNGKQSLEELYPDA